MDRLTALKFRFGSLVSWSERTAGSTCKARSTAGLLFRHPTGPIFMLVTVRWGSVRLSQNRDTGAEISAGSGRAQSGHCSIVLLACFGAVATSAYVAPLAVLAWAGGRKPKSLFSACTCPRQYSTCVSALAGHLLRSVIVRGSLPRDARIIRG
eukprot:1447282-Rhodomonas_salina.1